MLRETDDLQRLYIPEWVIVHTVSSTVTGEPHPQGRAFPVVHEAMAWVKENLNGRVREGDIQLEAATDLADQFWCHVKVFKNNLKGEFRSVAAAQTMARIHGFEEYTIVARNSKADHEIRSYGVTKL